MKFGVKLAALVVIAATSLSPAFAATTCLPTSGIKSTKVIDNRTIDFRMYGGKVYRNSLSSSCSGLSFEGFVYKMHGDQVCNAQSIRVLRTHAVCILGNFALLEPAQSGQQTN